MSRGILTKKHFNLLGPGTALLLHAADPANGNIQGANSWVCRKTGLIFDSGVAISPPIKTADYVYGSSTSVEAIGQNLGTTISSDYKIYIVARIYFSSNATSQLVSELTTSFTLNDGGFAVGQGFSGAQTRLSGGARGTTGGGYASGPAASAVTNTWQTITWVIDTNDAEGCTDIMVNEDHLSLVNDASSCGAGTFSTAGLYLFNRSTGGLGSDCRIKAFFILHGNCTIDHLRNVQDYCTRLGS